MPGAKWAWRARQDVVSEDVVSEDVVREGAGGAYRRCRSGAETQRSGPPQAASRTPWSRSEGGRGPQQQPQQGQGGRDK